MEKNLKAQGYALHTWSNGSGFTYPAHAHAYHKIIVVQQGSITFHLPNEKRDVLLLAGETLELPAGTVHAATVGPDGVTCLEGQK